MSSSTLWMFCVILVYLQLTTGDKSCLDCTLIKYCRKAKQLIEKGGAGSSKAILNAKCGSHKGMIQVCCSSFDIDEIGTRFSENPPKEKLSISCGNIARNRIKGGDAADIFEFPWMVAIAYKDGTFQCAGTLISPWFVLTAAHCVVNREVISVVIGDYHLVQDKYCQLDNVCEDEKQVIEVKEDIAHEEYNVFTYNNDIALLRLKSPAQLPLRNADIICLPTKETKNEPITDKNATVAGWGISDDKNLSPILRKVDIPVRSTEYCRRYYRHLSDPESRLICAGTETKDACRGDSGGPLMIETRIKQETKYVQYGIISNGPQGECGQELPGLYTDVTKHVKWIEDNMK